MAKLVGRALGCSLSSVLCHPEPVLSPVPSLMAKHHVSACAVVQLHCNGASDALAASSTSQLMMGARKELVFLLRS